MCSPIIRLSFPMLLIFLLVPGASAINIGISVGNVDTVATTNNAYDKGTTFVEQTIKAHPLDASLSNLIKGGGSLAGASRSISDANGNYAATYRSITGAPSTTWSYEMTVAKEGTGVKAEEWLTVKNAYSISAYGFASNAEGDRAQANVWNSHSFPSACLTNWYTKAHADSSLASAYQSADYAYAVATYGYTPGTAIFKTSATNKETDYVEAYTSITGGSVSNYKANAQSGARYAQADIYNLWAGTLSMATGGSIYQEMYARHNDDLTNRDISWVDLSITGNYYFSKSVNKFPYDSSNYPARAYSSKYSDKTFAKQSEFMQYNTGSARAYASNYGHASLISSISGNKIGTYAWTGPTSPYKGVIAKKLA